MGPLFSTMYAFFFWMHFCRHTFIHYSQYWSPFWCIGCGPTSKPSQGLNHPRLDSSKTPIHGICIEVVNTKVVYWGLNFDGDFYLWGKENMLLCERKWESHSLLTSKGVLLRGHKERETRRCTLDTKQFLMALEFFKYYLL